MNTIYIILLVAVTIVVLIFRFVRIDQTKPPKSDAESGTDKVPQPQYLFAEKSSESTLEPEPKALNIDVPIAPQAAADQVDTAEGRIEARSHSEMSTAPPAHEGSPAHKADEPPEPKTAREIIGENNLILYVVSNYGVFTGAALLEITAAESLRLENNVFHKYDEENNVCYRIANGAGEVGFESIHSDNFQTQAVALTIAFSETRNPVRAYSSMRRLAELMVQQLGAVLKDAEHNRITSQTLNYYKDNVVNYQITNQSRLS